MEINKGQEQEAMNRRSRLYRLQRLLDGVVRSADRLQRLASLANKPDRVPPYTVLKHELSIMIRRALRLRLWLWWQHLRKHID